MLVIILALLVIFGSTASAYFLCEDKLARCPISTIATAIKAGNKYVYYCPATKKKICSAKKDCGEGYQAKQYSGGRLYCMKKTFPGDKVSPYDGCGIVGTPRQLGGSELNVINHGGDPIALVDSDTTYLSCVDARTTHPVVSSFAGDIGEFLLGMDVYRRLCHAEVGETEIYQMLKEFVDIHATPQRPFYMHTDNTSLAGLLKVMGVDSFPATKPANVDAWYGKMFQNQTRYHGCGHVWYQVSC
jgi:hypothetical protein